MRNKDRRKEAFRKENRRDGLSKKKSRMKASIDNMLLIFPSINLNRKQKNALKKEK